MVNNMVIKKIAVVVATLLLVTTALADSYLKEEKSTNFIITPSVAYRYDVFKWSIPLTRFPQKKVSELIWKSYIVQPNIQIKIEPKPNQFTFLGQVKYGYILKKSSKSWDYDWFPDKYETVLESKTQSSVKGNILELSGAIGYSVNLFKNNLLTFYLGYDYSDYRNKNYGIYQQVDNQNDVLYPCSQLIAKYYFKTQSPWIGLSVNTSLNDKFSIIPTIKFYSFKYTGKGYWLLRDDLQQNPSFKHKAKGTGLGFDVDFLYKYTDNLDFKINLETKALKMRNGRVKTFFSEETKRSAFFNIGGTFPDTNKLYDLSLMSSSVSFGLRYKL
jgi:hypothetical protein